ncbi:vanillate O-demethylase ferredoxin subunit [Arcicella rosea]|uniref:PDR/VanB family oxidoreductase n=1 Tax=Arcicella rosea TaxID=502909 RepID=UPI00345C821C
MRFRNNWIDAKVSAIEDKANNVRQITLKPIDAALSFTVGSHIDVSVIINDKPEIRSYSLIGTQPTDGAYTIAVKRLEASRGGSKYMWTLEVDNQIKISQPSNHFELSYGVSNYLLIAGGIGITPLVGMAEEIKKKGLATVNMIYVGVNPAEMPYIDRLKAVLENNLHLHFSDTDGLYDVNRIFELTNKNTGVYLCGPLGFMNAIRKVWENSPFENTNLRYETFGASGLFAPQTFKVKLPRFNREIEVAENQSMLKALEEAGIDVMYDCQKGECGLCQVNILECTGAIDHRDFFFSEKQKQQNKKMCACVSRVANGDLVIDTSYRGKV